MYICLLRDQYFKVRQGLVSCSVSMLYFTGIQAADGYDRLELFNSYHFFFSIEFYEK